jgi:hypothetical protein
VSGQASGLWVDVAAIAILFAVGNIVFGRFEEHTPRWRRLLKFAIVMAVGVSVSSYFGRVWMWALLGAMALPVVYIHVWWLPSRGINGWTGEPRQKYYALRGWKVPPPGR